MGQGGGGGVSGRGGGLGVKVDVNEELKFLVKIHQKKILGGGGTVAGGQVGGIGLVGGGSGWM